MLSLKIKDVDMYNFQWLSSNRFSINFHGPLSDGDCSQTGVEIISDFYFKFGNYGYTMWTDRTWVNGYTEDNIIHCENIGCDCDNLYQGEQDYTNTYDIDRSQFPPPGNALTLFATVYQHCTYEGGSYTHCGECPMFLSVISPP
jgi:hypothetical protein